ncbi:hypothetical protein K2173_014949 [Erythroxylum novogranatense]|uniref:S-protein homolog n=1 Tax=Erythroxylum novogranatense TaxID=1862640 RepID=A0AAV8TWN6_9ROSI|nr:hypothetical protein K2173_014949 [Erythroxylum novogranatense]
MKGFRNTKVVGFVLGLALVTLIPAATPWCVHVQSQMNPSQELLVHCKSGDDDLGAQSMGNGNELKWCFNTNIIGTTLFWCYLASNNPVKWVSFNSFLDIGTFYNKCSNGDCFWVANDSGIWLWNGPVSKYEHWYEWRQGR